MICPVEIASDMSALRAVRIRDHAEHGSLSEGRDGAGDESTGRDVASDGEEDHVVAGGGDPRHQRPAHAAVAGAFVKACETVALIIVFGGPDQNTVEKFIAATNFKLDSARSGCTPELAHREPLLEPTPCQLAINRHGAQNLQKGRTDGASLCYWPVNNSALKSALES